MREINIPPIYVEDIISITFSGDGDVEIKYNYNEKVIALMFHSVYYFDYCEWEYIDDINWKFGLVEYKQSRLLDDMFLRINPALLENSFGGELEKICHYKLTIDDWGIYNLVCKDFLLYDN